MGSLLCDIYGIIFQRADENFHVEKGPPVNTLYLLLLDESGSMYLDWRELLGAAKSFA
jgi:hypothetical protein